MKLENTVYCSSGLYSSEAGNSLPALEYDNSTVIFMLSGSFQIEYQKNLTELHSGEVFICAPTEAFTLQKICNNLSFFWAQFNNIPDDISLPTHMSCKSMGKLKELFNQLCYFSSMLTYPNSARNSLIQLILMEINVQFTAKESQIPTIPIRICEWIRDNSDKNLKVEDVANEFGYNRDYLTRLMKREGYQGIKQIIISSRLDYIKTLLSTTELSIKEIGKCSGFENINDFFKFFKTHEGMTPSEFRKLSNNIYSPSQNKII